MSEEKLNKKLAEIKSLWGNGDPVYSNIRWVEELCIFISSWKYRLTSGLFYKIKYLFQRQTRGYDDLDKWNAAWFIARKAIPVLTEMRNNFKGTSVRWHTEDRFGNIKELTHEEVFADTVPDSLTEEEWRNVLDDIIFAFQFILNQDIDEEFSEEKYLEEKKRHKRGMKLFSIYIMNLWD